MQAKISLWNVFQAELFKTKNSLTKWIFLLFPVLISLIVYVYLFVKADVFLDNPWMLIGQNLFSIYAFLYPLMVSFISFMLHDIEYKNQGIKHLYVLPIVKSHVYISKLLSLYLYILLSVLLAYIGFRLGGNILRIIQPDLGIQNYEFIGAINVFFCKLFLISIAIGTVQYVISQVFSNFIVSLGFASFLTIICILFNKWKYVYFFLYGSVFSALKDIFYEDMEFLKKEIIVAICSILLFSGIGYFVVCLKNRRKL
jgi:hypothetical protein